VSFLSIRETRTNHEILLLEDKGFFRMMRRNTMKKMLLIPVMFFALLTAAHAADLYICVDESGKEIITSIPQDGMKCQLKETIHDSTSEQMAEKEKAAKTVEETSKNKPAGKTQKERMAIMDKCKECCGNKFNICYNYTANNTICNLKDEKCVAMCNSEGASTSEWSECWPGK